MCVLFEFRGKIAYATRYHTHTNCAYNVSLESEYAYVHILNRWLYIMWCLSIWHSESNGMPLLHININTIYIQSPLSLTLSCRHTLYGNDPKCANLLSSCNYIALYEFFVLYRVHVYIVCISALRLYKKTQNVHSLSAQLPD